MPLQIVKPSQERHARQQQCEGNLMNSIIYLVGLVVVVLFVLSFIGLR